MDRLTEEQSMHDSTRDLLSSAEKRASSYRAELDETKALFDRVKLEKNDRNFSFIYLLIIVLTLLVGQG